MTNQCSKNSVTVEGIIRSQLAAEVQTQVDKGLMPISIIQQGTKRLSEIVHPEGWPFGFENAWYEEVYAVVFVESLQPTGPNLELKVHTVTKDKRAELITSDELKGYSLINDFSCGEQTRETVNDFGGIKVADTITEEVDLLIFGKYC